MTHTLISKKVIIRSIPFIFLLSVLLSPLVLSVSNRTLFILCFIAILLYATYRSLFFSIGALIGFSKYSKELSVDWYNTLKRVPHDLPTHGFAIPVYEESLETVIRLINSIVQQQYDLTRIYVVISVEQRRTGGSAEFIRTLQNTIKNRFPEVIASRIHSVSHRVLAPEVPGAASNRTHAAKELYRIMQQNEVLIDHTLVTSPDADSVLQPQYCARTSTLFINNAYSESTFYQTGAYFFANRTKHVPFFTNAIRFTITFSIFADATFDARYRYTFSCFTIPFNLLVSSNFWDVRIPVDDTPLYWRMISSYKHAIHCESFFIPITVDTVIDTNVVSTAVQQYKQMHRWSWGIIAYPQALQSIRTMQTSLINKLTYLLKLHEILLFVKTWPILLVSFFLIYSHTAILHHSTLPLLTQLISIVFISSMIIVLTLKTYIQAAREHKNFVSTMMSSVFEVIFGISICFVFGLLPDVHAYMQFALSHGKIMGITWAPKINSKKL